MSMSPNFVALFPLNQLTPSNDKQKIEAKEFRPTNQK